MQGIEETKFLGKKESDELEKLIEKWVEARDLKNYYYQKEITYQITEKLKNLKSLISILKYINDNESINCAIYLEAQNQHFKDLLEYEREKIFLNSNYNNDINDETSSFLISLRDTTKEIDLVLTDELIILENLNSQTSNNNENIENLIPKIHILLKDYYIIIILLFILFFLILLFSFYYKKN